MAEDVRSARLTDREGAGGASRRWRRVALAAGLVLCAWAALYLAEASRRGSGASFESRATYDQVKQRTHRALPGALARGILGLALLGWGLSGKSVSAGE